MSLREDVGMVARVLMRPVVKLVLRFIPKRDPWTRVSEGAPIRLFGKGSQRDFSWYLEGESTVQVRSIDDIQDWLLACEYVDDRKLFNEADFWQHPRTFEHLRRGDCEDHALWAWRKLVELGVEAELVSGQQEGSGHVWVVLQHNEEPHVFETAAKDRKVMLRPVRLVRHVYRPEASVDGKGERFVYHGYIWSMRESLSSESHDVGTRIHANSAKSRQ